MYSSIFLGLCLLWVQVDALLFSQLHQELLHAVVLVHQLNLWEEEWYEKCNGEDQWSGSAKHWSGSANIEVGVQTLEWECIKLERECNTLNFIIIIIHYSPCQSAVASHLWSAPLHVPVTVQWGTGKWGECQRKEIEKSAIIDPMNNIAGGCWGATRLVLKLYTLLSFLHTIIYTFYHSPLSLVCVSSNMQWNSSALYPKCIPWTTFLTFHIFLWQ